jgi:hypothetical protein
MNERVLQILKIAGLGVVFWGLSLVWPEVNLLLSRSMTAGLVIVLAGLTLGIGIHSFIQAGRRQPCLSPECGHNLDIDRKKSHRPRQPSRPVHLGSV